LGRLDTLDMRTGVANRAHFMALAEREWARARRYGHGAGIVIVEIDRYRRMCDARGTAAGDACMRELAAIIGRSLRGADALARYSPSQLVVLLAQADPTGALDVAERVREHAEQLEVPWQEQQLRLTVSAGVATLRPAHLQLAALVQDADEAVDAARQAGGNCVRAAPVDFKRATSSDPSLGDSRAAGSL
jgi:diguanylate cyclase